MAERRTSNIPLDLEDLDRWTLTCPQCSKTVPLPFESHLSTTADCSCVEAVTTAFHQAEPSLSDTSSTHAKYSEAFDDSPRLALAEGISNLLSPSSCPKDSPIRQSPFGTDADDMSYQMRRFLYGETDSMHWDNDVNSQRRPSKNARKRSPSKLSRRSMQSCGSAHSLMGARYAEVAAGGGVDPTCGIGDWLNDSYNGSYGYPAAVGGIDDYGGAIFDDGHPHNIVEHISFSSARMPQRHVERKIVQNTVAGSCLGTSGENIYPLPRAWMTTTVPEEELAISVTPYPIPPITSDKTISIITLAKIAILLRRWIRKRRRSVRSIPLVWSTDSSMPAPNNTAEEQLLKASIPLNENQAGIPILSGLDVASSSYADSVDSLEEESTEDSQDDELILRCEEFATVQDILSGLQPLLDRLPHQIFVQLRTKLTVSIAIWLDIQGNLQRPIQSGEVHANSSSSTGNTSLTPGTPVRSQGKRASSQGDDPWSPEDPDDRNGKRAKITVKSQLATSKRGWACPYYQREPHRYCVGEWRLCAKSPGFSQVHRVKAHIYKHHAAIYCERCYTEFGNDEALLTHTRQILGCNLRSPRPIEGLSKLQKDLLRPRDRNKSEEERWNAVYRICFPDDQTIPSPFYVYYSRETAELRRELFDILHEEVPRTDMVNRERLFKRVDDAFARRSNLPFGRLDSDTQAPPPSSVTNNVAIESYVHDSLSVDPLVSVQARDGESSSAQFLQEPRFEGFENVDYWNNLADAQKEDYQDIDEWGLPILTGKPALLDDGNQPL